MKPTHIIYPPLVTWSDKWQRPHYLLKYLSEKGFIIHFIPWRIDDKKINDFCVKNKIEISDNFFVYKDFESFKSENNIKPEDRKIIKLTSPDGLNYLDKINHDYVWFDYLDDYEQWQPNLKTCFNKANFVTTSGIKLLNKAGKLTGRNDIHLIENGCDFKTFSHALNPLPSKYFNNKDKKFTIGFVGALCKELDYELINFVIKQFDFARFVFVGNEIDGMKFEEKIKPFKNNVDYFNVVSNEDLPGIISNFDVGIIIYDRKFSRVDYINSIKTYVYLSAGKKVVSVDLPDIMRYKDIIDLYENHNKHEFIKKLVDIYKNPRTNDYIEKAQQIAKEHDWDFLGEKLLKEVKKDLKIGDIEKLKEKKEREQITVKKECEIKKHIVYAKVISWDGKRQRPHHLLKYLAKLGWHTHFIAFQTRENLDHLIPGEVFIPEDGYGLKVYPDVETFIENSNINPEDRVVMYASYPPAMVSGDHLTQSFKMRGKHFHYDSIWYDFLDDFPVRRSQEPEAIKKANFVSASAKKLITISNRIRKDVAYVPNGGEYEHFKKAENKLSCTEMEEIKEKYPNKKIIGFFGYIAPWFDNKLIKEMVTDKNSKDLLFVFLGDNYGNIETRIDEDNILYLGSKHYNDLPNYLSYFDVAIIPFDTKQEVIHATNPCKIWEYLASGKPVVCTDMPEIRYLSKDNAIYIGDTAEDFLKCIRRGLSEKGKELKKVKQIRQKIAENNDWFERAKEIDDLLNGIKKRKIEKINFKPIKGNIKILCPSRKYAMRDLSEALNKTDGVESIWLPDIHNREDIHEIEYKLDNYLKEYSPDIVMWEGMCINKAPQEELFDLMSNLRGKYKFRLVYWSTEDPPHHNEVGRPRAEISDYVFATASEFVPIYNKIGKPASHLMFGANPWEHYPRPIEKQYECDVLFIGSNYCHHPLRREGFDMMFKPLLNNKNFNWKTPFRIYGLWWGSDSPWKNNEVVYSPVWKGCIARREVPWAYSGAKISLGIMIDKTSPTHLPFRPFETLACGSLHISQHTPALENVFGKNIEFVKTQEEFLDKLAFYLMKPEARKKQSEIGRKFVMDNHTYIHRANQVIQDLKKEGLI